MHYLTDGEVTLWVISCRADPRSARQLGVR